MRYYFHIALNGAVLKDQNGSDLPGLGVAQSDAIGMAEELERELAQPTGGTAGYYIEVMDEAGKCVFALPIYREHDGPLKTGLRHNA